MNADIVITEKPDCIKYEDIHELLYKAHESNRKKGLYYATAEQTGPELAKRVMGGVTFVALADEKLVGTASVDFRTVNNWYSPGEMAHFQMEGVHPDYKGLHIMSMLTQKRMEYAVQHGAKAIYLTSAEKNQIVKSMYSKLGFKKVDYFKAPNDNFFSVIYVKWLGKCSYSSTYIWARYHAKRFYTRIRQMM